MTLSPQGWAYEIVSGGERVDGFVLYDVRFWTSPERQRDGLGKYVIDGVRCDLANNFKMQIRENHQRIKRLPGTPQEPDGFMLHASGVPVPVRVAGDEKGLGDFLKANGNPARSGYPPFIFPNYAGVDEELSNEWQHERYTLPLLEQVEANIERYITVAKREGWEGDRRGTTLNLQVGAGVDDGYANCPVGSDPRTSATSFRTGDLFISMGTISGGGGVRRASFARIASVAVPAGATIDAASATYTGKFGESTSVEFVIEAIDADDPAAPTSTATWNAQSFTTASITWDFSTTWTTAAEFTTPELKTVIQEQVDRGGWATGQAMIVCVLDDLDLDADRRRSPKSYDDNSAVAPKLDITYTAGGGASNFKTVLGNMPAFSGLALRGKEVLGNLPTQAGVIIRQTGKIIIGNLPQQTSAFTRTMLTAFRTFVGNLPNPTGVALRGKTLLGNIPFPAGTVTTILNGGQLILGSMPSPSGVVTTLYGIKLFGNMPTQAGVIVRAATKTMIGTMPQQTGVVVRKVGKVLSGTMPFATGVILRGITILGNLPQQAGTVFKGFVVELTGDLPSQTGVVTRKVGKVIVGIVPNPTGIILRGKEILGNIPAQSGTLVRGKLTAFRTIAGNMPQISGLLIGLAEAAGNYFMKLRRKRTRD